MFEKAISYLQCRIILLFRGLQACMLSTRWEDSSFSDCLKAMDIQREVINFLEDLYTLVFITYQ